MTAWDVLFSTWADAGAAAGLKNTSAAHGARAIRGHAQVAVRFIPLRRFAPLKFSTLTPRLTLIPVCW
jgi:hypothetical protein